MDSPQTKIRTLVLRGRRAAERERLTLVAGVGALGVRARLRRRLGVLAFRELFRVLADRLRRVEARDADRLTLVAGALGVWARLRRRLGAFAFRELFRVLA